jgi:hypothetical protein
MYRKTPSMLGMPALLLTFLAGAMPAALAEQITGTPGNDVLPGTPQRDTIHGLAGDDDITPGKGNDRAFGEEGFDTFRWTAGDGQDRLDGGTDASFVFDHLVIAAGPRLRLHIDALDAGALTNPQRNLQVVGVKGIEIIQVNGTEGDDRLVLSSEPGIPTSIMRINCGLGRFQVDARNVGSRTEIECYGNGESGLIKGSREYYDRIFTGNGDDEIWTGGGGSYNQLIGGKDEIHLGKGSDNIGLDADTTFGDKIIFGFGADDVFTLFEIDSDFPGVLDNNGDGRLDAKDRTVKVRNGNMTIDFTETLHAGPTSVTLIGQTRVGIDRFDVDCGC